MVNMLAITAVMGKAMISHTQGSRNQGLFEFCAVII
jgi:hypothetical protein